ncbi:IPT/TIG domain-containing protein [Deinococcus roseus]|uniref:Cell surface protein n=1 Tax=Deinococcus roseus TaxID=392414 RepID=A0ABQ2CY93_9DEIO|nr:IPT/TIG domain-containing protein [Deinococcus roseus]GGJ32623.1 hypothetical protein GCM10008938_18540 [Deinococcus roseus]
MKRVIALSLITLILGACAPKAADTGVTIYPQIVQVSPTESKQQFTLQGRYLGSKDTGVIRIGANENGEGGVVVPKENIVSWTESKIVFNVPANATPGGSFIVVEVAGKRSFSFPFSFTR